MPTVDLKPNGDLTPLQWTSTGASHYTEIDEDVDTPSTTDKLTETTNAEVYAAEGVLDYVQFQPCEVYAVEGILDYELAPIDPCEAYAAEVILAYYTPTEGGWWGWYAFQFVVHPVRRFRTFYLFGGKQNLLGQPDEEKVREK